MDTPDHCGAFERLYTPQSPVTRGLAQWTEQALVTGQVPTDVSETVYTVFMYILRRVRDEKATWLMRVGKLH